MTPPIALTVAGSDSGGGAGIQADLKTFQAFGCFGTSAITAITAQNTLGVRAIHPIPPQTVRAQIDAVAEDLRPAALKSGMLATRELVETVADGIRAHNLGSYVLDPVMIATSGARLLDRDAERSIVELLLPLATVVTPNLDEAKILTGLEVETVEQMRRAAERLVDLGVAAALIKGGHMLADEIVDVLFDGTTWREWRRPKLKTTSTHGTGCTLSAAIAAGLAHDRPLMTAAEDGMEYLQRALVAAPGIGGGNGPVNHLVRAANTPPPTEG